MTVSYATDAISKQVYQKTSEYIQQEITAKNRTIQQLEKEDVYNKAMQKMRSFIKMLGKRDSMLDNSDLTKKSSQLYSILMKGVVNSLMGGRKVLSHKALQPFSLLEVLSIGGIQGTTTTLRTFFLQCPDYDVEALGKLEYSKFGTRIKPWVPKSQRLNNDDSEV